MTEMSSGTRSAAARRIRSASPSSAGPSAAAAPEASAIVAPVRGSPDGGDDRQARVGRVRQVDRLGQRAVGVRRAVDGDEDVVEHRRTSMISGSGSSRPRSSPGSAGPATPASGRPIAPARGLTTITCAGAWPAMRAVTPAAIVSCRLSGPTTMAPAPSLGARRRICRATSAWVPKLCEQLARHRHAGLAQLGDAGVEQRPRLGRASRARRRPRPRGCRARRRAGRGPPSPARARAAPPSR